MHQGGCFPSGNQLVHQSATSLAAARIAKPSQRHTEIHIPLRLHPIPRLPGSIFLGIIAILPALAMIFGISNAFASFYGGTSLLILVGVVLDTLQQVESYLLMRHYDGLMKTGRLSGRSGM